jgi:DNA repair exonuclease SbcCD nuclease subunit
MKNFLGKTAMFTDIHWGCRNNLTQHNQDNLNYVEWFKQQVIKNKCDSIIFMGDWFENRNAINISTLNMSYDGLSSLNSLDLPIYFIIGNHDLYHRENRELYSTYHFKELKNVTLINEPLFIKDIGFFPFLFKEEYPDAAASVMKHKCKYVFGHFEFKDFVVTGANKKMEHGPEHSIFSSPKVIFSGHFHKRQIKDNVIYIGNTFPTNYGDINDDERGMCILDTNTDDISFIDWKDCPKFRRVKLSKVIEGNIDFPPQARVECIIDTEISYSDIQLLKEEMIKSLNLREFSLEPDSSENKDMLEGEEIELDKFEDVNQLIVKMLKDGITNTSTINADLIIDIYTTL